MQATNPLANYFYAMAMWKENGQPSDAASVAGVEALLKKAVSLDAQCGPAWLQLGVLSDERKDYNGAISYFQKAVAADPEMSEAHYRLGTAYDRLGERDKAKLEFDLHETIDREQKAQVEQQRRAIKQFQVLEPEQTPDQAAKP
jgi:tetratricopeptide (TPR) repeat protein